MVISNTGRGLGTTKKIVFVSVAVALCSLLVAGCASPLNSSSPSPATGTGTATAQHDALLEKLVPIYQRQAQLNFTAIKAWEVTWVNNTTVDMQATLHNKTSGQNVSVKNEFQVFPSTANATTYLNSIKDSYSLVNATYVAGGAYQLTTGHAPTVYKQYAKVSSDNTTRNNLYQFDNVVQTRTVTVVS